VVFETIVGLLGICRIYYDAESFATGITLGSSGNGGNFAPSLFLGSYVGFFFSKFINLTGLTKLPVSNFTLVGMAGILSGLFHAPDCYIPNCRNYRWL
jgi:H+/Cl- antiporter ClcA